MLPRLQSPLPWLTKIIAGTVTLLIWVILKARLTTVLGKLLASAKRPDLRCCRLSTNPILVMLPIKMPAFGVLLVLLHLPTNTKLTALYDNTKIDVNLANMLSVPLGLSALLNPSVEHCWSGIRPLSSKIKTNEEGH